MTLDEEFWSHFPGFDAVLKSKSFVAVPSDDDDDESMRGMSRLFRNHDFEIAFVMDRGRPGVSFFPLHAPHDEMIAEYTLPFLGFEGDPQDTREAALFMERHYDLFAKWFVEDGYLTRKLDYERFAMEALARRKPKWQIEKTDKWQELQK